MNKKFNNKTKSNNKGNKSYSSKFKKDKSNELDTQGKDQENNYTFYAADEQIAKDAASIPFNYISGGNFNFKTDTVTINDTDIIINNDACNMNRSLLNLSVIHYIPSIGITNAKNEGVNMSSLQLYAYVRRSNSGARNYEAPDMMMYGLSYQELLRAFFNCKRALGLVNKTHYYNHAFPDLILKGLGFDPDDLRSNSAQYRARLNTVAKKINSFAFPNIFKSFDRMAYVSNYLFCDSTSPRAQFYAMRPDGYYYWSGTTNEQGTELIFEPYFGENNTQNQPQFKSMNLYLDHLEQMVDALFLDEDALTMSGDIMKAFPENELYQLDLIDENYTTEAFFDEDFLGQIENARFVCKSYSNYNTYKALSEKTYNVTQSNQIIKFNPQIACYPISGSGITVPDIADTVFNSHVDNPDYKNVLEWTRLTATSHPVIMDNGSANKVYGRQVDSCGLEIPLYMLNIQYGFNANTGVENVNAIPFTQEYDNQYFQPSESYLCQLMQLDWHPVVYYCAGSQLHLGFDSKITTKIPKSIMQKINQTAVYGAFYTGSLFKGSK